MRARIEHAHFYSVSEWGATLEVFAEWDDWEENCRLDFVVELPLREDQLHKLPGWRTDGLLTSIQTERFRQLEELIDRNRPALERLLEDQSRDS